MILSREEFRSLAEQANVIPLVATFVADVETPVSAFAKFRHRVPCFLFESAEKNEESGRFSFIGAEPFATIHSRGDKVSIVEDGNAREFAIETDPLAELQKLMERYRFAQRPD